ncbi:MAG: preprotein translocase subunit SecA [Candidatus Margulisiibacteriota bacterium]
MLANLLKKLFGDPHAKRVKEFWPMVEKINALEPTIEPLSDAELKAKTQAFRDRLAKGEDLDALLPEAFAVVREASKRTLKMRHFDVQLIGGMVLHQGKIAEMRTGEGKTLVSTLPAYLNALEGKGVYVVTVNDYLAKRDSEWMGQVFRFLGLSVGLIQANMSTQDRIKAYGCDITYGTNNEFGFDYLRDNLVWNIEECTQTRRHFAIIDEVDSILIDEARTPLIISGPVKDSTANYAKVAKAVKKLEKEKHFTLDEKHKNVVLTEEGIETVEKVFKLDSIYSIQNMDMAHMVVQSLKALYLFKRDVDYVIKDGEVLIVDEFTGRILEGRRYSDGLHQAIEAIENLSIREESQTLATVTFQNYFRMFPKLAGMTGTALTEEAELNGIYGLEVVVVPTHRTLVREDLADVIYKSKAEKYTAIAKQVQELHVKGQPVLLGTISIEISELLSAKLKKLDIPHNVLNAKYHEREAEIIAKAGQLNAVTIATNMAGRGTDIMLGEGVSDLGGLFVIGSERHESRRIDNQLRGRSGRQGDPGATRFYVSLEDDLMRLFGSDRIAAIMEKMGVPADTPIEHPLITRSISKAQSKVEQYHFGVRKQILQYDDVMNKQRETIYALRRQFLEKVALDEKISDMIVEVVEGVYQESVTPEGVDTEGFFVALENVFPAESLKEKLGHLGGAELVSALASQFEAAYQAKKKELPEAGLFDELVSKRAILMTLDRKWIDHLHNMEVLREGIGLRAYGQKDPLLEYKIEAFDLFSALVSDIGKEALEVIFKTTIVFEEEPHASRN